MKRTGFITFEGPDGSGKTTISRKVVEALIRDGYDVVYTREPGGIEIAEEIRNVILDPKNIKMDVRTEALLYAASRRQHLVEKILPALEAHKLVICDRFVDSSLAYQGIGRGIGIDEVFKINQFAIADHMPELTLYLDVHAQTGLSRITSRKFKDRLDQEDVSFHLEVVKGYEQVVERFKDRIVKIDGNRSIDAIVKEALEVIYERVLNR
ncbi:MAG: dTMP kinase [Erysipelothrix sp.]|jgi:dTMP kinase|nr:dTMP kinase [Erysipelothrix sp.]